MESLRDLKQMATDANNKFCLYDRKDFVLPQIFKDQVKEINSNKIVYNDFSAVIESKGNQYVFLPNQWFYIASYFTDLYNELQKYRMYSLSVTSKERLKELNRNILSSKEMDSLDLLDLNSESKEFLTKFITDYSWWGGAKTIDRNDFYVSPILAHAKLVNASQSFVAELCAFLADKQDLVKSIIDKNERESTGNLIQNISPHTLFPRQVIYYGAPGTGKSHKIKERLEGNGVPKENIFRTTFHPDSDYSTFVGAYKPTMAKRPLYGLSGDKTIRLNDGGDLSEDVITYNFVPQVFLQAYIRAYEVPNEEVYLVIEEINRGNCAQVFGDLFQLLDRDGSGKSEYAIKADADLRTYLENVLGEGSEGIKEGELCLPSNLYIYATMNTSDQSLFPIDSAFKRRWDWEYEPIKYKNTEWTIKIGDEEYSWVSFQKAVNNKIKEATDSEDKMLGDYFVNPSDGVITDKLLLNKVLFYLWNDVCKDGEGEIFKTSEIDDVTFSELYGEGGEEKMKQMMAYLGVMKQEQKE